MLRSGLPLTPHMLAGGSHQGGPIAQHHLGGAQMLPHGGAGGAGGGVMQAYMSSFTPGASAAAYSNGALHGTINTPGSAFTHTANTAPPPAPAPPQMGGAGGGAATGGGAIGHHHHHHHLTANANGVVIAGAPPSHRHIGHGAPGMALGGGAGGVGSAGGAYHGSHTYTPAGHMAPFLQSMMLERMRATQGVAGSQAAMANVLQHQQHLHQQQQRQQQQQQQRDAVQQKVDDKPTDSPSRGASPATVVDDVISGDRESCNGNVDIMDDVDDDNDVITSNKASPVHSDKLSVGSPRVSPVCVTEDTKPGSPSASASSPLSASGEAAAASSASGASPTAAGRAAVRGTEQAAHRATVPPPHHYAAPVPTRYSSGAASSSSGATSVTPGGMDSATLAAHRYASAALNASAAAAFSGPAAAMSAAAAAAYGFYNPLAAAAAYMFSQQEVDMLLYGYVRNKAAAARQNNTAAGKDKLSNTALAGERDTTERRGGGASDKACVSDSAPDCSDDKDKRSAAAAMTGHALSGLRIHNPALSHGIDRILSSPSPPPADHTDQCGVPPPSQPDTSDAAHTPPSPTHPHTHPHPLPHPRLMDASHTQHTTPGFMSREGGVPYPPVIPHMVGLKPTPHPPPMHPHTHPHTQTHPHTRRELVDVDEKALDLPKGVGLFRTMFAGVPHYGIFCQTARIPKGTRYGPFPGRQVNIFKKGHLSHFVDGRGSPGNWMSYVNCARYAQEQNLLAIQNEGDIYYEVCKEISEGTELLVWYGESYLQFMGIPLALKDVEEHAPNPDDAESSAGYQCDRCGKMFAYEYYRDKHLKYTRCVDQGDRKYPCHLCTRSFEKRDRLRIHILHVHEKHRPHKCTVCGKSFSQSSSLNKHMRVHSGERPYKCVYCNKAFTASSILRTHIRQHSGEKPFKCKHCGKAFASHAAHDSHVRRTHTKERPCVCKVCGRAYAQAYELKFHMEVHRNQDPSTYTNKPQRNSNRGGGHHGAMHHVTRSPEMMGVSTGSDDITITRGEGSRSGQQQCDVNMNRKGEETVDVVGDM